jgi:hypothetical protein
VEVHANREVTGWTLEKDVDTNLVRCSMEQLLSVFLESELEQYINSMCIDPDTSEMKLHANYNNYEEYKVQYLTIVECKNTTEKTCATHEEILKFIRSSQMILTVADTKAFENIYEEHATYYKKG